jgi:hypothetical protein
MRTRNGGQRQGTRAVGCMICESILSSFRILYYLIALLIIQSYYILFLDLQSVSNVHQRRLSPPPMEMEKDGKMSVSTRMLFASNWEASNSTLSAESIVTVRSCPSSTRDKSHIMRRTMPMNVSVSRHMSCMGENVTPWSKIRHKNGSQILADQRRLERTGRHVKLSIVGALQYNR